jgi:hypothetical protein
MSTVEGDKMTNGDQCANRAGSLQAFQRRPLRPTEIEDCSAEDCELQYCNRGEEFSHRRLHALRWQRMSRQVTRPCKLVYEIAYARQMLETNR